MFDCLCIELRLLGMTLTAQVLQILDAVVVGLGEDDLQQRYWNEMVQFSCKRTQFFSAQIAACLLSFQTRFFTAVPTLRRRSRVLVTVVTHVTCTSCTTLALRLVGNSSSNDTVFRIMFVSLPIKSREKKTQQKFLRVVFLPLLFYVSLR
jgi:hypothetical protein